MKKVLLVCITSLFLTACGDSKWEGFVFHSRHDRKQISTIGTFDSLEACRNEAISVLKQNNLLHSGDYACGLNCARNEKKPQARKCEKMER